MKLPVIKKVPELPLVAPFAGAWIEMFACIAYTVSSATSLPSRERGLKSAGVAGYCPANSVAPFAGAWIEIKSKA